MHLGPFRYLHETWCKTGQPVKINAKVHATPLDPKLMFWCISFHLGPFCYCPKLGAVRANMLQLMQKLVSKIFAISTPDPHHWTLNSCFSCVLFCLGAFGTVSLLHETRCKMRQTVTINPKVSVTKSCRNISQRMLLIHTSGP